MHLALFFFQFFYLINVGSGKCEWSNWKMEMICEGSSTAPLKTNQHKISTIHHQNTTKSHIVDKLRQHEPLSTGKGETTIHAIKSNVKLEDILHIKKEGNKNTSKNELTTQHHSLEVVDVVFSTAVYTSADNTLALVKNIHLFNQGHSFKTVLHVAYPGKMILPIVSKLPQYNAHLNPTHNVVSKGGLKIMRAHFSNFLFAESKLAEFRVIFFLAENSYFILPGVIPKIADYDSLLYNRNPAKCQKISDPEDYLLKHLALEYNIPQMCPAKHTVSALVYIF